MLTCCALGKQKITDQIAQLKYKDPNSQRLVVLEQELVRAEAESLVAEAQLSNITREKVKAASNYQFDALREHCEKLAIIAGYGKHLLELIDDQKLRGNTNPVIDRDGGARYDGTWSAALAGSPDWMVVTSWNEWFEDTEIEPGVATGSGALEQTASWSQAFKQQSG